MKGKIIALTAAALILGVAIGVGGTLAAQKASAVKPEAEKTEQTGNGLVGIANPVAGLSREEALEIAVGLAEGKDMGTWRTMSAEEFLRWWADSNNQTAE